MNIPQPWEARAARLQWQAAQSEANRRVKLEARRDAAARLAEAQAKRAQRNARRRYEADCQLHGVITAHWITGSHA
jgi:hypothetical protein